MSCRYQDRRSARDRTARRGLGVGVALASLLAGAAEAQGTPASVGLADFLPAELRATDTVVITGKRQQRQRDIVGNVTTLDGGRLEQQGAQGQEDIFMLTPGVQFNKGQPNQALPTLRGIGTVGSSELLGTQQATTGFYVEDVPFTDPFGFVSGADIVPFDLDRVELLRGPQGVLYGSASLGGAVNYVFNKPDLSRFGFSLLARAGQMRHGGLDHAVYAMLNMPWQPGVAGLRMVAFDRRDAGYISNLGTGQARANGLRQAGGRLVATLRPIPTLNITGTFLSQRTEQDDSFAVSPDPQWLRIDTPTASARRNEFRLGKLQVDLVLGLRHTLTSISAYVDKHVDFATDVTRSSSALGALYGPRLGVGVLPLLPQVASLTDGPVTNRAVSEELRMASTGDGAFQYMAGALYHRTRLDLRTVRLAPGGQALWGPAGILLPNDQVGRFDVAAKTTESAVFADAEYHWTTGLTVGLGGRRYRTSLAYDADLVFFGRATNMRAAVAEHGFTPRIYLKSRFGEHTAYVLASKGYRFGGVNLNPPQMTPYRSDALWNQEIGLRLVPGPAVRLDLSVFVMDWRNAQVSTLLLGPLPSVGVANVGQARSRGLEAGLGWQAARYLAFTTDLAFTDARTTVGFTSGSGSQIPSGTRLPGTPRWQSALQALVDFAGPAGAAGRFTLSHAYVGPRAFDIEGQGRAGGYSRLDLRLALVRGPWEWGAAIDNLLDARGVAGAMALRAPGLAAYTDYFVVPPRRVGLSLRYDLS